MLRKICFLFVLCLMVHRSAAATSLEFGYEDPVFIDVVHTSIIDASGMGDQRKTEMKAHFLFKLDTGEVNKEKTTCTVTILDCDDSTSANGKVTEKDSLKGFKNQKFEVVIGENNQKIELRKTDAVIKAATKGMGADLAGASAADKKMLEDMMEQILQVHLVDALIPLPEKPVEKGNKWRHKSTSGIPGLVEIGIDREFVFQGEKKEGERNLALIEWSSKVDFDMKKNPALPFNITEKPGATQKNEGSITWDLEARRPSRVENKQSYQLEINVEAKGKQNKATVSSSEEFIFTYLDKNPSK